MQDHPRSAAGVELCTRRLVAGGLIGAVSLVTLPAGAQGRTYSTAPDASPPSGASDVHAWLHQQVDFRATPPRIYEALLNSRQFTAITGEPAKIDPAPGGAFSLFGNRITGRNVELAPNLRIVQAWRSESWEPGVYSIVRFQLRNHGPQTRLLLDQAGFPEGEYDSLSAGWKAHYWDPLERYMG
jgi:activator of HSP90 ATPase